LLVFKISNPACEKVVTFAALLNDPLLLFITRSLVAALVIPGTVAFSYAGAFGLSILVWQHLIGLHLHWLVLPLTFIILVAVGSDYNLLLINRVKEEMHAGLHTGLIRALGSTGGVVTSAGWCSHSPCWRCSPAISEPSVRWVPPCASACCSTH
jgi:uncharacterized membrane protein YdfJ with MMPL/SSD domain